MQVLTLEIADDFIDTFKHVLDALPSEKVSFKKDRIKTEIEKRLKAIDNEEVLIPYMQGMDEMREGLQNKYTDS